eukprot:2128997-Amphidinium_carterae.5
MSLRCTCQAGTDWSIGPFWATAALALQAWIAKHGDTLQQESQDELSMLLNRVPLVEAEQEEEDSIRSLKLPLTRLLMMPRRSLYPAL